MILFMTRFPPDRNGFGGAQRAWHILQALLEIGPVDLMVVYRHGDTDIESASMDAETLGVRLCRKMPLNGWEDPLRRWPSLPYKLGVALELVTPYCTEAPILPRATLREVAASLPDKHYDLIVAGRLPSATILDRLLASGEITTDRKVLDLDDVLSDYKRRWLTIERAQIGRFRTWVGSVDADRVEKAERGVLNGWDAVSVCSEEDVDKLRKLAPRGHIVAVPNVVDRDLLPPSPAGPPHILFVGSLASRPNLHGLNLFVDEAWPKIRRILPEAVFDVVGMHPTDELRRKLADAGVTLHADVPLVQPFYEQATVTISPIFFGSGTRIKVIETLAYGRALVSSALGAEGLGVVNGEHAMIHDDMDAFADAVVELCRDPALAREFGLNGRALYERKFGPKVLRDGLHAMIGGAAGVDKAAA